MNANRSLAYAAFPCSNLLTPLLAGVSWALLVPGASGQELLQDPGLEASTGASQTNPFWTLDVNMPAGTAAQFQDAPWASNPNGEAGIGLWFQAFQGSEGSEAEATLHQAVEGSPDLTYTLSAFFKRETNFTASQVLLAIDFLDGESVLQSVELDVLLTSPADGTWNAFQVKGNSPAGTDGVRARAEMVGGVNGGANPQSAMFDDFSLTAVPKVTVPVESLIGFYPFDDPGNPFADDSGAGNELISAFPDPADPTYTETGGFRGGGYEFDGQQRLIAPIEIGAEVIPDVTMGAWVKTGTLTPALRKVIGSDNGGWDRTIGLDNREPASPELFRYTSFTGTGVLLGTPGPVNTEDWTFIAAVYDTTDELSGEGVVTVYVDLNANTTGDDLVAVSGPSLFNPGAFETSIGSVGPGTAGEGWIGSIDNVFFFEAALTAEQMTLIRDAGTPTPSEGDDPDLVITAEPPLADLPKDPAVKALTYAIRNAGLGETLEISAVNLSGDDAATHYSVTSFPATLAPGESGSIVVTLDTLGQVGAFNGLVEIVSNDESDASIVRDASATVMAVAPADPVLAVLTDPVFGDLPAGAGATTRVIQVQNSGASAPLMIGSASVSGMNAGLYTVDSFTAEVAPGGTGEIVVTLDSAGAIGAFAAELTVVSNDGNDRFTVVDLAARIPPENIRQALLGFYPFDDGDQDSDLSGNGNDLAEGPGPPPFYEAAGGIEGGAYEFIGSHLVAPININPTVQPELTMGAFVKAAEDLIGAPGLYKILGSDNGGWDRTIGLDNRQDGEPAETSRYTSFNGFRRPVLGTPLLQNSQDWTFVAATYSELSNVVTVYVDLDVSTTDDDLVAVSEESMFNASQNSVSIGSLTPTGTAEAWNGFIDNVFFYGVVLSPAQLADIRTRGRDAILGNAPVDSRLWFTSIAFDGGGNVVLEWDEQDAPGPYLVERFDNEAEGWAELGDGVTEKTFTDMTASGASERLYRVSQE